MKDENPCFNTIKLSRTQNTKLNILFGLLSKIVTLLLPFAVRTVFIYTLGIEFLGLNSLFVSILQVLNLTELGFSSAIVYSMYKPVAENDTDLVCALLSLYRKAYRIIGCVIVFAGLCIMPFLQYLVKGEIPSGINIYVLYLLMLGDTALSYFLFAYKQSLFMANQEKRFVDIVVSITSITKSCIQIMLLIGFKNYYLYLCVTPFITVMNNIIIGVISKIHFPKYRPQGKLPQKTILEIKKNVGGLMIQKVCQVTRNSLDSIIISAFIGLAATAMYNNYFLIISSLHGILTIIPGSMQGSVGNSVATETREKNHDDMQKFMFMYAWVSGVCTVCLICVFQPFMELWLGKEMLLPNHIMFAFCFYLYLMTMGDIRTLYVEASGIYWEIKGRAIMESALNLILNLLLGRLLGVFGIVLATIISMFLINFVYGSSLVYKHYFKNGKAIYYYLNSLLYLGVTSLICFLMLFILRKFSLSGWVGFFAKGFTAFVCSNILFFMFYFKNQYFKSSIFLMKNLLHKRGNEDK